MSQLTKKQLAWCEKHLPKGKWKVNAQGRIDVNDQVSLDEFEFKELPVMFGKINGFFSLSSCKNLTSLKGSPIEIYGSFYCDNCTSLTSLKGITPHISVNFYCDNCTSLTTLKDGPLNVEFFSCKSCTSLTSLEGIPKTIVSDFDCEYCELVPKEQHDIIDSFNKGLIDWDTVYTLIHRPKLAKAHSLGLI